MASMNRVNRARRAGQWFARARRFSGYERHSLLLVVKSTAAATVAWGVGHDLMAAQAPAFAPFSAVLMMQATVYQSVVQSLRHVAAVVAGVILQGLVALALGPNLLAFAITAVVALALSRWPKLGAQGTQVSTASFFAFSLYVMATQTGARFEQLVQILMLVLIGCGVGVAVNMLVFPPMRYRSAEYGIRIVCHSMTDLLHDIVSGVRENELDAERTGAWRHRAGEVEKTVAQARTSVVTARESIYYNPRRIARRQRNVGFSAYGAVVEALDRIAHQLVSMTRCLDLWYEERTFSSYADFLSDYADFMTAVAEALHVFCELDTNRRAEQDRALGEGVESAEELRRRLSERAGRRELPLADHSRPYGVLVVEATRLMEELKYARGVLSHGGEAVRTGTGREFA
jgi:uncharacterized membrane protein YgaE (UPF0421/DUF939 family)